MSLTDLLEGALAGEMSALNILFILGLPVVAIIFVISWIKEKIND